MFTEVTRADYIGDYKVSVLFNDGVKKTMDFYNILKFRTSTSPMNTTL